MAGIYFGATNITRSQWLHEELRNGRTKRQIFIHIATSHLLTGGGIYGFKIQIKGYSKEPLLDKIHWVKNDPIAPVVCN